MALSGTWTRFIVITAVFLTQHSTTADDVFNLTINATPGVASSLTYSQLKELQALITPEKLMEKGVEYLKPEDAACVKSMWAYLGGVLSTKGWALQMLDSTGIIFGGILKANHEFLGFYDECVQVVSPQEFTGQHCVLQGNVNTTFPGIPESQALIFFYGMCVPSTCSAEQLTRAFSWVGKATKGLITLEGRENFCNVAEDPEPTGGESVVIAFLAILGCLACLSTCYDVYQRFIKENKKPHAIMASFSVYSNGKSLFNVTHAEGQMECLNGLRVLSMIWIVYFHTFTTFVAAPVVNVVEAFAAQKEPYYAFGASAFLAVDTFLLVSGLLVAYSFFNAMARTGTFDAPSSYIHRYIRITPAYAMVLLFQVTLFQYLGNGPIWGMVQSQAAACRDYWWSGLLYVQNFVNPDNLCLVQTWYLSADMQLYWLSPLLLYPMYKWPKFAPGYITFVTLIFTFLPFALAYTNGFSPIPIWDTTGDQNRLDNYPTYSRATPWLVGIGLGYLICQLKQRKIKVNLDKVFVACTWIFAFAVGAACIFGLVSFENDKNYTDLSAAVFLAFHRLGWAIAIGWLIFACFYGYGGPINGFLSWSPFQPLGKLSFGVYLTHISVLLYRLGIIRTNIYFNSSELFFMAVSIWAVSHAVAVLLHLFIEAPFGTFDRHYLRRIKILPLPKPKPKPPMPRTEVEP